MNIIKLAKHILKNSITSYQNQRINHKKYEKDVLSGGALSNLDLINKSIDYCESIIKKYKIQNPKILDIGCGNGSFSKALKKRAIDKNILLNGFDIFFTEDNKRILEKTYNKLIVGDIIDYKFREKYDILIANQIIEHIPIEKLYLLLDKFNNISRFVVVSVPFSWHSLAYNKDYLISSIREKDEMSNEVFNICCVSVHKGCLTTNFFRNFGYKTNHIPVYHSFFFIKGNDNLREEPIQFIKPPNRFVSQDKIKKFLSKYYNLDMRPPNRLKYEMLLTKTILSEPLRYKVVRVIIKIFFSPVYSIKNLKFLKNKKSVE